MRFVATRFLEMLAERPEVKKAVGSMREHGLIEVLRTIGLVPSPRSMVVPAIGIFATGAVFGATAALLLAPRTGEALRQDLAELINDLRRRASDRAREATDANGGRRASDEVASAV